MGWEDFRKNIRFEVGAGDRVKTLDRSMMWGLSTSLDLSECVWDCF